MHGPKGADPFLPGCLPLLLEKKKQNVEEMDLLDHKALGRSFKMIPKGFLKPLEIYSYLNPQNPQTALGISCQILLFHYVRLLVVHFESPRESLDDAPCAPKP